MKSKILVKGFASLLSLGVLAGCSSDYLQVDPATVVSSATVQTTPEGAQAAMYGLCGAMYTIYVDFASNLQPNGEGTLQQFYGDVLGSDYYSYFWCRRAPFAMTMDRLRDNQTWLCTIPWSYCYNLIGQANTILDGIDNIEGDRDQLDFIKAQALTIRAHAYVRILQLYGPRWADSYNGERMVAILRTTSGTEDLPLSSMNAILKRIYDDLDIAIDIFESTETQRKYIWEPDEDVARGIYCRAALLKDDWATAQVMAREARKENRYPIMSEEQYKGGFAEPNQEWMWSNTADSDRCGYWSNGAYYAVNGAYVDWNTGCGAINYELYRQIPEGDIRADLFFTPDKLDPSINNLSQASFWNSALVDPATMSLQKNANMKNQYRAFGLKSIPEGGKDKWELPYYSRLDGSECYVFFGSQYKFWCVDGWGTSAYPFMRAAEMLLNEAEAACHNNDETTAIALLKELNAKRNPNYTCNKSGDALLKEVKLQRRIELWGEGFNWFDLKRWGEPLVRNTWEAGNMNSNNIPQANKLNMQPADMSGWRWAIPLQETQYNNLIDRSLLE